MYVPHGAPLYTSIANMWAKVFSLLEHMAVK